VVQGGPGIERFGSPNHCPYQIFVRVEIELFFSRRDEEILQRFHADYELFGVRFDGSRAYLEVEYTRRVTP
jgi:hypothetical protein